jgi:pimeloyl-ACP methyl ester carboxylesterase
MTDEPRFQATAHTEALSPEGPFVGKIDVTVGDASYTGVPIVTSILAPPAETGEPGVSVTRTSHSFALPSLGEITTADDARLIATDEPGIFRLVSHLRVAGGASGELDLYGKVSFAGSPITADATIAGALGPPPAVLADRIIRLDDGRALAFAEFGHPDGPPVMCFHGVPGSRFVSLVGAPEAVGVRMIVPDRPGVGRSDPLPGRSIADWASDVRELADHLDLDRFAILGISGGGPYATACGAALPERVSAIGFACPSGPYYELGGWADDVVQLLRVGDEAAAVATMRAHCSAGFDSFADPERSIASWAAQVPRPDAAALRDPAVIAMGVAILGEVRRGGLDSYVEECLVLARPWPFRLEDVEAPAQLLYGDLDPSHTAEVARYYTTRLPRCSVRVCPGEGHWVFLQRQHVESLLRELGRSLLG